MPAQLRKVRVVAPYLAGVAWPRTPLAFYGNPQTFPNPIALGRYEWLVPAVEDQERALRHVHGSLLQDPQSSALRVREGQLREDETGLRACPHGAAAPHAEQGEEVGCRERG